MTQDYKIVQFRSSNSKGVLATILGADKQVEKVTLLVTDMSWQRERESLPKVTMVYFPSTFYDLENSKTLSSLEVCVSGHIMTMAGPMESLRMKKVIYFLIFIPTQSFLTYSGRLEGDEESPGLEESV